MRVTPRSKRDGLAGVRDGALVVRLTAPPVEGQANAALVRYVGRLLGLPHSALAIARGASGRDKVLRVAGLSEAALRARILEIAGG